MLRRLVALLLAFTCAFAPAATAFEFASTEADSCCCGTKCPCPPADCAPAPAARTSAPAPNTSALEQRALAAKPRARVASAVFARFLSAPLAEPARTVRIRATHTDALAPADRVALYEAHCSFLL